MTGDEAVRMVEERYRERLLGYVKAMGPAPRGGILSVQSYRSSPGAASSSFGLWLQCGWPEAAVDEDDIVYLGIQLAQLDRVPRLDADVCWDSGHVEASFREGLWTEDDRPILTDALLIELDASLPKLLQAFTGAVAQGPRRR